CMALLIDLYPVLFVWKRFFCFFFSSRRRHTRSKRDWSSDVCSSDLPSRAGSSNGRVGTGGRSRLGRLGPGLGSQRPSPRRLGGRSEERRVGKECRSRWGRAQ